MDCDPETLEMGTWVRSTRAVSGGPRVLGRPRWSVGDCSHRCLLGCPVLMYSYSLAYRAGLESITSEGEQAVIDTPIEGRSESISISVGDISA